MNYVIIATVMVGAVGIIIGLLLGVAGEAFKVEVDPREEEVLGLLPGNNCGGCGFAGCAAAAKAIAAGEAPVNACPVGGAPVAEKISEVMGVAAGDSVKQVAFVRCTGTCDIANVKYNYYGIKDCQQAMVTPGGGAKSCTFGCLGYGSCEKACPFDAIHVISGIAKVDQEKCKACSKCIAVCPKKLITLVPYDAKRKLLCSNTNKGKTVKEVCASGCIGCGTCAKQCPQKAITMENNLPVIDLGKCDGCGKCVEKCPAKVLV